MTRVKVIEGFKIILPKELRKTFAITEGVYLTVDVDEKKRIVLTPSKKESSVEKTQGILKGKVVSGVKYENKMRKEAEKRINK